MTCYEKLGLAVSIIYKNNFYRIPQKNDKLKHVIWINFCGNYNLHLMWNDYIQIREHGQ